MRWLEKMWLLSAVVSVAGALLDGLTTRLVLSTIPESYEANPLVAPVINSPLMLVVEMGWLSFVVLLPYLLAEKIRHPAFRHLYVMGFVYGAGRLSAAIHNLTLLLSVLL